MGINHFRAKDLNAEMHKRRLGAPGGSRTSIKRRHFLRGAYEPRRERQVAQRPDIGGTAPGVSHVYKYFKCTGGEALGFAL